LTNPVMQLLLRHKAQEVGEKQAEVNSAVTARLGVPPVVPVPAAFDHWCGQRGLASCPAQPETIALYVMQSITLDPRALCAVLEGVTAAHHHLGDPVSSWQVNRALEERFGVVKPPKSWGKDVHRLFDALPYFVRTYIGLREKQRDTALRQSQNELAAMKQELKKENANVENQKDRDAAA
jgi:hypothetical protein